MNQPLEPDNISAHNEQSINTLARAISYSRGEFSLILVRCNYAKLRQRMMAQLRQKCPLEIRELELPSTSETLYTAISEAIKEEQPQALAVFGLERVQAIDTVLASTNQVREEFRKSFVFPLVLWINDDILKKLIKQVPDLESWASVIEFEIPPDNLKAFLQETADAIFEEFLEVGAVPFLNKHSRELSNDFRLSSELHLAQREVQHNTVELEPELAASLEFLIGLTTASLMKESRHHYEQSLVLWPLGVQSERRGCVNYQLGLWWRTYAVQHRSEYEFACEKAVNYYQQAIDIFETINRPDLIAKFIEPLAEVLQRLQRWETLESLAQTLLTSTTKLGDLYRQASANGFIAEAAIGHLAWNRAKQAVKQALQLLDTAIANEAEPISEERQGYINWQTTFRRGWYLFALGRAQWYLDEHQDAIKTLELARTTTRPEYDPPLFIQILCTLRHYYFEQKEYLKAFDIRLEYRSLEQQYGFIAFVGAGRLQPQREVINPALATIQSNPKNKVSQEIAASGRQESVNRLIERISRADQKLIVLHGQSGVGKSSIIQAGLIPSLEPITLDTREVFTVLQQVYTNWTEHLGQEMLKTFEKIGFPKLAKAVESPHVMLEQLRESVDKKNSMVVLIFDQFEEFFFVHKEPGDRKPFYDFLKKCLNIPYVKVILSLREDYLHYLLECNDRLVHLDVINNNILDKGILFYLGNFSRQEAKSVFQSLTKDTPYPLSPELTEELVQDLSEELGEIRPIELQVVGAQLQTEQITTLEVYREKGPKDKLVSRFLDEVTRDCGPENEDIARLVLYLLTDENNTRPLKTREDIELEINVSEKLDLILTILVKSGLVFRIPSSPSDRYQLVHDYLVIFVRQGQSTKLIAELEKEREQRQLTEKQLNEALQKQLRTARKATFTLTGLVAAITGIALLTATAFINTSIAGRAASSAQEEELKRVMSALGTGKFRKGLPGVIPEVHLKSLSEINQANNSVHILSEVQKHTDEITDIAISSNGDYFASSSKDKTVIIWKSDGTEMFTLTHPSAVNCVEFSPDGTQIATGDSDGHVRIWGLDGELIAQFLKKNPSGISAIAFSNDGKTIASGGVDSRVYIWNEFGDIISILENHNSEILGIRFNSSGDLLATFSEFDPVIIWSTKSWKEISRIENYTALDVDFKDDLNAIEIVSQDAHRYIYEMSDSVNFIGGEFVPSYSGAARLRSARILSQADWVISVDRFSESNVIDLGRPFPGGKLLRFPHDDKVTDFEVSEEIKVVIAADKTNKLTVWDVSKLFENIKNYREYEREIRTYRFRKTLTAFSEDESRKFHPILLHPRLDTIVSQYEEQEIRLTSYSQDLSVHLNGNLLASTKEADFFVVRENSSIFKSWNFNAFDSSKVNETDSISKHNSSILSFPSESEIATSDDGHVIAIGSKEGFLKLLEVKGKEIFNINAHENKISNLSISQNKKTIISTDNTSTKIWSNKGNLIKEISASQTGGMVDIIEFSPNGDSFITYTSKGVVRLWTSDGNLKAQLDGHTDPIQLFRFSPHDETILTISTSSRFIGGSSRVRLWNSDGSLRYENNDLSSDFSANFSFDGQEIYFHGYAENSVKRININGQLLSPLKGHVGRVTKVMYIPDSRFILTSSEDGTLRLWDKEGNLIRIYRGHRASISSFDISPDLQNIASIDNEGVVKIWELNKTTPIRSIGKYAPEYSENYNNQIFFSSDGSKIILQGGDYITILDSITEEEVVSQFGNFINLTDSSVKSDPEVLISINQSDKLSLWSTDGKILKDFGEQSAQINSAAISPDRQKIAFASRNDAVIILGRDGKLLENIEHEDAVNSVAFSKDGKFLVTASNDELVRVFDAEGNPITDNAGNQIQLEGHADSVTSVLFSPDGRTLASASSDGIIKLWNIHTWQQDGQDIQIPTDTSTAWGPSNEVDNLWFSEDGNILAYGTNPTHVQLLNRRFGSGTWIKQATFHPVTEIPKNSFSNQKHWVTVEGNRGTMVLSLGLDHSLKQACIWVASHIRLNGDEGNVKLCNGILESQ